MNERPQNHLTIVLPAGRLPLKLSDEVNKLAREYDLELYLTTTQNLRLLGIADGHLLAIKQKLVAAGAQLKTPGMFPLPKICVGRPYCKLALADTEHLSQIVNSRFGGRTKVKPKFKIAISGCPASCAGSHVTDIGVVATRSGLEVYVGGKGGPFPQAGRRIARKVDEQELLRIIAILVDYHTAKTSQKQRMYKLLEEADFPYPDTV